MQILFLLEPLQQKLIVAGEDVPIEVAKVIAGRVVPVVRELDTAAELHRPTLGQELATENSLRDEREILELLQELRVEQRHGITRSGRAGRLAPRRAAG